MVDSLLVVDLRPASLDSEDRDVLSLGIFWMSH